MRKSLPTVVILVVGLLSVPVAAKRQTNRKAKLQPPSATAPAAAPPAAAGKSVDELLADARHEYDQLEYDKVIPLARAVIGREGVPLEKKLDAYLLQGSALAIVGDPIDAETPFRLLLEYRPDYDLPADTPPKILAVFSKVKLEVEGNQKAKRRLQRDRTLKTLRLRGDHPTAGEGGLPIVFNYSLKDPNGAVDSVSVQYRRKGEKNFSVLALKQTDEGRYKGAIPPDWTANDNGTTLEYFVETRDDNGPLLVVGAADTPMSAAITPGSADRAEPPPLPVWGFGVTTTAAVAVTAVWAGLALATEVAQVEYWLYVNGANELEGRDIKARGNTGWTLAILTNAALITAVFAWGATAGVAAFTNWSGQEEVEY